MLVAACIVALLTANAPAQAEPTDREIDAACEKLHPNLFGDFFSRRQCVFDAKEKRVAAEKERKEKERQAAREERARGCIADEIPRLEGILSNLREELKKKSSLEEVTTAIETVTSKKTAIVPADNNIKEKVLIGYLLPKCDTAFYFLINVQVGEGGELRFFRVWAEKPPKGYVGDGAIARFTLDWEGQRKAAEAAETQRLTRKLEAVVMERIGLINLEAKCVAAYAASCPRVRFNFGVANKSQTPIYAISFGWNFVADSSVDCPEKLVTKKTERSATYPTGQVLIGPNETRWFSVDSEPLPDFFKFLPKWCFRVTQLNVTP